MPAINEVTFTKQFFAQSDSLQEVVQPIHEIQKTCLPPSRNGEIKIGNISIPFTIKEVAAVFDSRLDIKGFPISGEVKVTITTI